MSRVNPETFVGQKFHNLTVLKFVNYIKSHSYFEFLCDCGNIKVIRGSSVFSGNTKKCGFCKIPKNLIEQKFGLLTVVKLAYKKNEHNYWECVCECGKIKIVSTALLMVGAVKTCGDLIHIQGKNSHRWMGYGDISKQYWLTIENSAKQRNLSFNVTIQDAWNLFLSQDRKCALTKIKLIFVESYTTHRTEQTASLDRIDSLQGYEIHNIQWVHKDVNFMKQQYDQNYYIDICKKVAENNK